MDPSRRRVPPPPPQISTRPLYPPSGNVYHPPGQQRPLFPSSGSFPTTSSTGYREWDEDRTISRKPQAYYTGGDEGVVKPPPSRVSFNLNEDIFEDRSAVGRQEVREFEKIWQEEFKDTVRDSLDRYDAGRGESSGSNNTRSSRDEEYEYARRYDQYDGSEAPRPGRHPPSPPPPPPLQRPVRTSVPRTQVNDDGRGGEYVPGWKKLTGDREERYESGPSRYPAEPSRKPLGTADTFDESFFVGSPEVRSLRVREVDEDRYPPRGGYVPPEADRYGAQKFSESDFSDERFLQRRRLVEENQAPARRLPEVPVGVEPALRCFRSSTGLQSVGSDQPSRWAPSRFEEAETVASKPKETVDQLRYPGTKEAASGRYPGPLQGRPEFTRVATVQPAMNVNPSPPILPANRQETRPVAEEYNRRPVIEEKLAENTPVRLGRAEPQPNRSIPLEDGLVQVLKETNGKVTQAVFHRRVTHIEPAKEMGFAGKDIFFHMKRVKGPLAPGVGDTVSVIAERVEMLPFDWNALSIEVLAPDTKKSDPELIIPLQIPVNPSPPLGQRKPPPPPILSKKSSAKRGKSPDSPVVLFDGLNIKPLPKVKSKAKAGAKRSKKARSSSPKRKIRRSESVSPPPARRRSRSPPSPPKAFRIRRSSRSRSNSPVVVRRRVSRSITPPGRRSRSITPPLRRRRSRSRSISPSLRNRLPMSRSISPPLQQRRLRSRSRSISPPPRSRLLRRSRSITPPPRGYLSRSRSRSVSPVIRFRHSRSRSFSPVRRAPRSRSRSVSPVQRNRRSPSPLRIVRDRFRSRSRSPQRIPRRSMSPVSRRRHSRSPIPTSVRLRSRSRSPPKVKDSTKTSATKPKKKLQAKVAPVVKKDPPRIIVGKRIKPKTKAQEPAYKLKPPEDTKPKAPLGLAPEVMKEAQERITKAKKEFEASIQQASNPQMQSHSFPNPHFSYGPNPPPRPGFYNTGFYGPAPPVYGPGMPSYGPPQQRFFAGPSGPLPMYRFPPMSTNIRPTQIMRTTVGPDKSSAPAVAVVVNPLYKSFSNNTTIITTPAAKDKKETTEKKKNDVASKTPEKIIDKPKETPTPAAKTTPTSDKDKKKPAEEPSKKIVSTVKEAAKTSPSSDKDKKKSIEEPKKVVSSVQKKDVKKPEKPVPAVVKENLKPTTEAAKKSPSVEQVTKKSILKEPKATTTTSEPKPVKSSGPASAELLADDNFTSENDFMDPQEAEKLGCDPEFVSQAQKWMACLRCAQDGHLIRMCNKENTKRALPFEIAKAKNRMTAKKKEILSRRNIQLPSDSTKVQSKSAAAEPKRSVSFLNCTKQITVTKPEVKKTATAEKTEIPVKKPKKLKPSQETSSKVVPAKHRSVSTKEKVSEAKIKRQSSLPKVRKSHPVGLHAVEERRPASSTFVMERHRSLSPLGFAMATNDPLAELEVKALELQSLELREMEIEQEMKLLQAMSAQNRLL